MFIEEMVTWLHGNGSNNEQVIVHVSQSGHVDKENWIISCVKV